MIIDFHAHIYPDKIAAKAAETIMKFYDSPIYVPGTADALLENGRKAGISRYVVHSCATKQSQIVSINNFLIAQMKAHEEFIGFGTVLPGYPDFEAEIRRMKAAGIRGVKLHPDFQQFAVDAPEMDDIYECIAAEKLVVLVHAGDCRYDFSGPRRIAHVLDKHPSLDVVAAHFGGYTEWEASYEHLAGRRLWFDTSSTLWKLPSEYARKILSRHGVENMLFGSDFPTWDYEGEFKRLETLGLSSSDRDAVFYQNATALLEKNR